MLCELNLAKYNSIGLNNKDIIRMVSNLKNIYHEKYNDLNLSDITIDEQNMENNIDIPIGWSLICLDETINYYTENMHKTFDSIH
uniref:hypothetical protein n=1 Tax=Echinothamnion hookeri TaxID=2008680 RepID=UPI002551CCBA|nr:hypothetical protein QQP88_pgp125 [Echinothamnion hookeri]WGH14439.1 hypothetical protein [Echinothamnion hookeri]